MIKEHPTTHTGNIYIPNRISKYITTCQKDINDRKIINKKERGTKTMTRGLLNNELQNRVHKPLNEKFYPKDYLNIVSPNIPTDLISSDNYEKIKNVASHFKGNLTSFFGFEASLMDSQPTSDYLFAISSENGEREELLNSLLNKDLSNQIINTEEWGNITRFTQEWVERDSIINKNVLGIWFEFDTSKELFGTLVPNIFLQIKKTRIDTEEDLKCFRWIPEIAIPLLTGKNLSPNIEKKLIESVKKLPEKTSLIHIGTMLSRDSSNVRIVINRIKPNQIIPYLQSIGYQYDLQKLEGLLEGLKKNVSRLILHLNISSEIDEKIGIECSFSYDKYHEENEWENFLRYLEENNLCTPEKKEALLNFIGAEFEDPYNTIINGEYIPSVMVKDKKGVSSALVRYISHIKIIYMPNKLLTAKAYPGVRLLSLMK